MKLLLLPLTLLCLSGCASQKNSSGNVLGDTRTKPYLYHSDSTFLITNVASDSTYGYSEANPVKVGGVHLGSGPRNERRFLEALRGPKGERLIFSRAGSCCSFETPNGVINNSGLLDRYRVTWSGSSDTISIYLNMYDEGDLFIPIGLTARK